MRYTVVGLLIIGLCAFFIQLGAGGNAFYQTASSEDGSLASANKEKAESMGKGLGSISCEEAHALIRAKKDDRSLREGIWQLSSKAECPVLSREAYMALNQAEAN